MIALYIISGIPIYLGIGAAIACLANFISDGDADEEIIFSCLLLWPVAVIIFLLGCMCFIIKDQTEDVLEKIREKLTKHE